jgi:hypothetical protein
MNQSVYSNYRKEISKMNQQESVYLIEVLVLMKYFSIIVSQRII